MRVDCTLLPNSVLSDIVLLTRMLLWWEDGNQQRLHIKIVFSHIKVVKYLTAPHCLTSIFISFSLHQGFNFLVNLTITCSIIPNVCWIPLVTLLTSGIDPDQDLLIVLLSYLVSPKEELLNCLCSQHYPEIVRWMKIAFTVNCQLFFWAAKLVSVDIPRWGIAYFYCSTVYTEHPMLHYFLLYLFLMHFCLYFSPGKCELHQQLTLVPSPKNWEQHGHLFGLHNWVLCFSCCMFSSFRLRTHNS